MALKIVTMKVADLVPYALNVKTHSPEQVAQIAASISEYGMNDPIAVWHNPEGDPVIVEGHGRLLALEKLHRDTCPVISLDHLTDDQRRSYGIVHNQLTMNTGFDLDRLSSELEALEDTFDASFYGLNPESAGFDPDSFFHDAPDAEQKDPGSEPETVTCPNCGHEFVPGAKDEE